MDCIDNVGFPANINIAVIAILLFNFVYCIITMIPFISMKKNKLKSDYFIIYYKLYDLVITFYLTFFVFIDVIKFKGQHYPEPMMISLYFFTNCYFKLAISLEEYISMYEPTFMLFRIIKKTHSFLYELIYILLILIFHLIQLQSFVTGQLNDFTFIICSVDYNFIFVNSLSLYIIILIIIVLNIIVVVKKYLSLNSQINNNFLRKRILIEILELTLKIIFKAYIFLILFYIVMNREIEEIKTFSNHFYFYVIVFVLMILIDNVWLSLKTYHSDFYYYLLSRSIYKKLYGVFDTNRDNKVTESMTTSLMSSDSESEFKNFIFDTFLIKTFDNNISLIFLSLHLIFSNKENLINKGEILKKESEIFHFKKSDFNDIKYKNLISFTSSLQEELKVEIKSFFFDEFFILKKEKGIDVNILKSNFLNMVIKNMEENTQNQNEYCYFGKYIDYKKSDRKSQIVLMTHDKSFFIEMLPNNYFTKENLSYIKSYLKHCQDNSNTFLPLIVGAYSVKINGFKEMCFLIFKNKIKEMKHNYNSWYLIKIKYNFTYKLDTSSKDIASNIIFEDENFFSKRNYKIQLASFNQFKSTIINDIDFLQQFNIKQFSLSMLYYEMENETNKTIESKIESKGQHDFRLSNFSRNDLSAIPIDGKKEEFGESAAKEFGNWDESKLGFEAIYRNFKSYNYFMFENVFQEKSFFKKGKFYEKFKDFILGKFDEINI